MQGASRRRWLKNMLLFAGASPMYMLAQATAPSYPEVRPRNLVFPRDFGAHPEYRTEWWYLTGWLGSGPSAMGFQVTFFRSRVLHPDDNPSRFAPRQLMFAHAALSLPNEGKLRHSEIAGRAGPAGASFDTADTALKLSGWTLRRTSDDRYLVYIQSEDFSLRLEATPNQKPMLRGEGGYSRKGPTPELASYYYSRPQLRVSADISLKNTSSTNRTAQQRLSLTGAAWFDHEWSSSLLMPGATGWDWIGINLLDGSSLMAFRIRDKAGKTLFSEWDWRDAQGQAIVQYQNIKWQSVGRWRSPRSLVEYPESFVLHSGGRTFTLQPLMADQEVDARASTGGFYYEGAVVFMENDKILGRGYLELTGYGAPMEL